MAAQSIMSAALRLGVANLRTAVSESEALARLGEHPAELVLVDTAITRSDPAGFTRRVLALAPRAVVVLFGPEEPQAAAAAVAAGARGVIRGGGDNDVVGTVTKALLLIGAPRPEPAERAVPAVNGGGEQPVRSGAAGEPAAERIARELAARAAGAVPTAHPEPAPASGGTVLVPAQRGDLPGAAAAEAPVRHAALTERELQVLRGMASGKSNAEIGRDLYVSEDTVKTHARRLFRKLKARDRAHAVAVGFRSGALP
jgi:DNA-binding NarL/FixJ family response regulator